MNIVNSKSISSRMYTLGGKLLGIKKQNNKAWSNAAGLHAETSIAPKWIYKKYDVVTTSIGLHRTWFLKPQKNATEKHLLYLHGGAYVHGLSFRHWRFVAKFIDATNCTVVIPDYPLAPKHTATVVTDFALVLYKQILSITAAQNITIMGDSAGGGLSLSLAQLIRNENLQQPSNIILLSPWLDVSMSNPNITSAIEKNDPLLGKPGLIQAGKFYAGELDTKNELLSPIYGNIKNLAPITLFIGAKDIFITDCKSCLEKCKADNIEINYWEYTHMLHVWMLLYMPEAKLVYEEIIKIITK
jgi:epsilon-lactone hydrolase